ncbi:hypothetical protein K435DRAFT_662329, partial [Dendrothele bispora CBS 962.96]
MLYERASGKSLGKIPLVIGMPVVITNNFDVGGGIVNGTNGILKSIRYTWDGTHRHATSCVVEIDQPVGSPMTSLRECEIPVVQQASQMVF